MIREKSKRKQVLTRPSRKTKPAPQGEKPSKTPDQKAMQKAAKFFSENEQAICDYAQQAGLIFERGDHWSIDMQTGRGTFDPKFFVKRGYTEAESMWATCHEIEHFRDWKKDTKAYANLFTRTEKERRLDLLYRYVNNIMANREENRRFPAHRETLEYLYEDKLFPRINYVKSPRHLQFIYALVRETVLPWEELALSPEVRAAIDKLKNIDGEGTDLILLASDPTAKPQDRFDLIQDYIEPVFEQFFQEDVREYKEKKRQKSEEQDKDKDVSEEESMEGGSRGTDRGFIDTNINKDEDYFAEEYDESEEKLPRVLSPKEAKEEIEKEIRRRQEDNKSPEQIAKEQFRARHGVSAAEIEDYSEEYKKIEYQIKPLRGIFERIIATRKEIKRRLKERTDQGVIIDPSMIAQAYIDTWGGIASSRTQLKIRKEEFDEHKLREFEFTLICDLSGSMNEDHAGGKSYEQKLATILIMEALDEFEKKLKEERLEKSVNLHILTEVRGFHGSDEELKPLSDTLDFSTRVRIAHRLENCTGNRTADYKSLTQVAAKIDNETKHKIDNGDLKKVLILITDGGSDDVALAREAKDVLIAKGIIVKAIHIGHSGTADTEKFRKVWGRDGAPCKDVSQLVRAISKLLQDFLKEL